LTVQWVPRERSKVLEKAMKRSQLKEMMAVPEATHEELAAAALKTTVAPALTAQAPARTMTTTPTWVAEAAALKTTTMAPALMPAQVVALTITTTWVSEAAAAAAGVASGCGCPCSR
jgi:hypothetical protein